MEAVETSLEIHAPYVAGGIEDQPSWFIKTLKLRKKIELSITNLNNG